MRERIGPYAAIVSICRPPATLSMRKVRFEAAYCWLSVSIASRTRRRASRLRPASAVESAWSASAGLSSPSFVRAEGTSPSTSAMRISVIGRSASRIAASTRSSNGVAAHGSSGSSTLMAKSEGWSPSADLRDRRLPAGAALSVSFVEGASSATALASCSVMAKEYHSGGRDQRRLLRARATRA